jgi:solute carrier family 45, member 1/2/4
MSPAGVLYSRIHLYAGFLNLADWKILRFIGGSQFRKVCVLSLAVLLFCVGWTCW